MPANHDTTRPRAERLEGGVLVAIMLIVGIASGAASFTHVHNWTLANSPAGTPGWFGWANACISELVPIASLLEMRRRHRAGKSIGYPMALMIGAMTLSLAAQLAVAQPGPSGWLLSAVPSLAFIGLSKLVLHRKPAAAKPVVLVAPAEPVLPAEPVVLVPAEQVEVAGTPEPVLPAEPTPAPRRSAGRTRVSNREKVTRIAGAMANATPLQVAVKAGVSERTARRYMALAEAVA